MRMPKDVEDEITGADSGEDISIPQKIRKKMPKDFSINDIGRIDLKEAEAIAREEILFFTEKDLIGDLEDLDLTRHKDIDRIEVEHERGPVSGPDLAGKDGTSALPYEAETQASGFDFGDGRKWIPLEELDAIDHDDREWIPLEHIAREFEKPRKEETEHPAEVDEALVDYEKETAHPVEVDEVLLDHGDEVREGTPGTGESELDTIAGRIVHFEEGPSYVMKEANIEEDREMVADVPERLESGFEEFSADMAQKYQDEELDYVHAAIVKDDYGKYIWEIDEFYGSREGKTVSNAVELLGLTSDEYDSIEDVMFGDDYKSTGMMDRYLLFDYEKKKGDAAPGRENVRYLLPRADSLIDTERNSIESDISSDSALIIEEDVEEIRREFKQKTGKDISGDYNVDLVTDITDRVVILEDASDVDRFLEEFPKKKQTSIKMMLKYLDGLFEKLPEEIIKKFAGSEYFDLYLKVLNELGV
jgi:hypothetical protein